MLIVKRLKSSYPNLVIVKKFKLQTSSLIIFNLNSSAIKRKKAHTGQIKGVMVGLEPPIKEKISTHLIVTRLVVLFV